MNSIKEKMNIKSLSWIFPFCFFIFGYLFLYFFSSKNELIVPNIIGKNVHSSIKLLAEKGLSLRLLREQEDLDLPEGVILDQMPKSGQKIKTNQNILVTVSKKPAPLLAPDFLGQDHEAVVKKSSKIGIQTRICWFKSVYPINTCIAQYPCAGEKIEERKMIAYFSSGAQNLYVVPNFKDYRIEQLKELFKKDDVSVEVFHLKNIEPGHVCVDCKVLDQKPIAGSIVDLNKKLFIQLQVE
jgi:beta-lactam-binding protein with PASTA domain